MENVAIRLNDADLFDKILKGSLPEGGDLMIITKDNATVGGNPAVMISFSVELPTGGLAVAQTVTTLNLLMTVLNALKAKYGQNMEL